MVVILDQALGFEVRSCTGEEVIVEGWSEALEQGREVEAFAGTKPCHDVFVVMFVGAQCFGYEVERILQIGHEVVGMIVATGAVVGMCSGAKTDVGGVVPVDAVVA